MSDVEFQYAQLLKAQEIRATAALAAGSAWAGISAVHDRDQAIIKTAKVIEEYIKSG